MLIYVASQSGWMYKTPRLGLHFHSLFFGILFAIAIFSLPLMATLFNVHQHQVMAQTQNATNNNPNASSPRVHNLPASPSTPNVLVSKAATTTPNSTKLTVQSFVSPINLTKPSTIVKFKGSVPAPNDSLTFYIIQKPSNGNLSNVTRNSVTYTPKVGFIGPDKFTYRAIDKVFGSHSNIGTVILNHPPAVSNTTRTINGSKPVKIQLVGSDPDRGDKLTFSLVQKPLNALLSDPSGNLTTYAPNPGFIGQDKFTYRAKDSAGLYGNNGTVTINVGKPLVTVGQNVTGPPVPTSSFGPLTSTVLTYAAIVALFMFIPLVYDMVKTYNQKGKPATEAARNGGFPDLARSLMAFGIIIILAILAFHVLVTITYSTLPTETRSPLIDIIKNLSTILGGAVSAIIGFYFGQRTAEKSGTTGGTGSGGTETTGGTTKKT